MDTYIRKTLTVHSDPRGLLWEALHRHELGPGGFGQLYVVRAYPGQTRGNHCHHRKTESFIVLDGQALLELWRDDELQPPALTGLRLDGDHPELVMIPPGVFHRIVNDGSSDLLLLAHSDEPYDPGDPDTEPWVRGM